MDIYIYGYIYTYIYIYIYFSPNYINRNYTTIIYTLTILNFIKNYELKC